VCLSPKFWCWPLPTQVAEIFTGSPGKYVDIKATISGFKGVLEGKYDDLPEMAFYMVRGRGKTFLGGSRKCALLSLMLETRCSRWFGQRTMCPCTRIKVVD